MLARIVSVTACATIAVGLGAVPASADPTPTCDHLTPANSLAGRVVHVVGTGLTGADGVTFAGVATAAAPTTVTDTDVTVTVPDGAQSGAVTVTTPSGTCTVATPDTMTLGIEQATIKRGASYVLYPKSTVVTATLTAAGLHGLQGVTATLHRRVLGGPDARVASKVTPASGAVAFVVSPRATSEFWVSYAASSVVSATSTPIVRISARPLLTVSIPTVAPVLTAHTFAGVVYPHLAGHVVLQRLMSGAWHNVATASPNSTGHFAFSLKAWTAKGTYGYRVTRAADALHIASQTSTRLVRVVDRTLRPGMSGADVSVLQRRLRALHYDVPAVSGTYSYDTQHAVIAFEKVQRLTRDGIVTPAVWTRLGKPTVPHLLHPLRGVGAIEVDLTRQVLYYAVDGAIVRILDVSTGGGYTYTGSDGRPSQAITPMGHFHVVYKVNRWVTSKLGTLYKPAYFNNSGYAIHGEGAVPTYPASHGCVRITVPAMDRMYSHLTTGMSVWIYRS